MEDLHGLDRILGILAFVTLIVQAASWWWIARLGRGLGDGVGSQLIRVVGIVVGWSVIIRIANTLALWAFVSDRDVMPAIVTGIVSQIGFLIVTIWAWRTVIRLNNS